MITRQRILLTLLSATVIGGLGTSVHALFAPYEQPPAASVQPVKPARTEPAPDPLTIEALRARSYPGGAIKTEQELPARGGCATSIVSYPSDGLNVKALMQVPRTTPPPGGYPVIILNHGYYAPGTYKTDTIHYGRYMNAYCGAGFLMLRPDYRGHGSSEGSPSNGNFSPDYTYDVLNLVSSLDSLPQANPERLGMVGHSMGGHVTMRVLAVSDRIKASVMMGGVVAGAGDILYNWTPNAPGLPGHLPPSIVQIRDAMVAEHGDPRENKGFWHDVSAINYLDGISGPVQIHHGTRDESVPYLFSQRLAEKLAELGKPHELFLYEGGDHYLSRPADSHLFFQRSIPFFKNNL